MTPSAIIDAQFAQLREILLESPSPVSAELLKQYLLNAHEACLEVSASPAAYASDLADRRRKIADRMLFCHDFGAEINEHGGWVCSSTEKDDRMAIDIWLDDAEDHRVTFELIFQPGRKTPIHWGIAALSPMPGLSE